MSQENYLINGSIIENIALGVEKDEINTKNLEINIKNSHVVVAYLHKSVLPAWQRSMRTLGRIAPPEKRLRRRSQFPARGCKKSTSKENSVLIARQMPGDD